MGCPLTSEPSAPSAAARGPLLLVSQDYWKNRVKLEALSTVLIGGKELLL